MQCNTLAKLLIVSLFLQVNQWLTWLEEAESEEEDDDDEE